MIRSLAGGIAACIVTLAAGPSLGQSIPCGVPYTVRPGDTLQRIATRAYGPDASFRDLMAANRDAFIRGDPSMIAVGQVLAIPCRDEAQTAVEPATSPPGAGSGTAPEADLALIAVATTLEGVIDETLPAALARSGLTAAPARAPVGDPLEIVGALRDTASPAIGTGVPKPPCERTELLSAGAQALCRDLAWSAPFGETVLATFTLAKTGLLTRDTALQGRRLCIPSGVPDALLEGRGLTAPDTEVRNADTAAGCLTLLRVGEVDAALIPAAAADAALAALPPGEPVIEQFALAQLVTLHAVALHDDPAALGALAELDRAVGAMVADGSWFDLLRVSASGN